MKDQNRRNFLGHGGAVLAAGALAGIGISANAADHQSEAEHGGHMKSLKGIDAFVISASEEGICGTRRY